MEVLYAVCCGLDVHKASVTACLRSPGDGPPRRQEVRTFGTSTRELLRLADWLTAAGCTHVAMESTGIYWRPVYKLLEGSFELSLVNAQHVKMVPCRKTAVRDSEWLAQLLELGLLRRSFVPPAAQRELRDVIRDRPLPQRSRTIAQSSGLETSCFDPIVSAKGDRAPYSMEGHREVAMQGMTPPVSLDRRPVLSLLPTSPAARESSRRASGRNQGVGRARRAARDTSTSPRRGPSRGAPPPRHARARSCR